MSENETTERINLLIRHLESTIEREVKRATWGGGGDYYRAIVDGHSSVVRILKRIVKDSEGWVAGYCFRCGHDGLVTTESHLCKACGMEVGSE